MYFGTHSYPWIRTLPKSERDAAMSVVYEKDRWCAWRFWAAIAVLVIFAVVDAYLGERPFVWWHPLVAAAAFFAYLMWEINGPIFRAAKKHFEALEADNDT